MGQKVHPYGFRLGIIRKARSRWFAEGKKFREQLLADMAIRNYILRTHRNAGISDIVIERTADNISVTVQTAKPGIIIGRGGRDVDQLRQAIEQRVGGRVRLNVEETPDPDLNAQLVAENIAGQIERRVSHRRAMQQAVERALRMGAQGVRVKVSGRLAGAEIARSEGIGPVGRVPLHTLRADVDYGLAHAHTAYGPIGVKVWLYKGEILPPRKGERRVWGEEGGVTAEDWERVAAAQRARMASAARVATGASVAPPETVAGPASEAAEVVAAEAEVSAPEAAEEPVVEEPASVEASISLAEVAEDSSDTSETAEPSAVPEEPAEPSVAQEDEQDVDA
jgi:small subunit ribosomal protein S3